MWKWSGHIKREKVEIDQITSSFDFINEMFVNIFFAMVAHFAKVK